MASVTKYSSSGAKSGTATLDDATFGITPNVAVMHQIVTNQLATRRAGTQSTKTRSEVRGGGAKPFRQKGTGNARQGSIRAPHYVGGGVALGPKPRSYAKKAPKKMINLALRSALSDRASDDKVFVVDSWSFDKPSTKAAEALLGKLGVDSTVLVVANRADKNAILSFRNLPLVQLCETAELNAYDVLANDYVIFAEGDLPTFDGKSADKADAKAGTAAKPAPAKSTAAEPATDEAPDGDSTPAKKAAAKKAAAKSADADAATDDDSAASKPAAAKKSPAKKAAASKAEATDAPQAFADTDGEFAAGEWPGSVLPDAEGNGPESHPIKGNAGSMLYHVPGSSFYKRTKAEVWFDTEDNATKAGFELPPSQREGSDS